MKAKKITACLLALVCIVLSAVSCSDKNGKYDTSNTGKGTEVSMVFVNEEIDSMKVSDFEKADGETDFVLIKVKDYGEIVVVLREDIAPVTVKNFKKLVSDNFYDGLIFHRAVENFMIQGGGYDENMNKKSADAIKGEFTENGVQNNLTHNRGVISMARLSNNLNSASSEFFIMHKDNAGLNGKYASFGYVLAGMNVVDSIASCDVVYNSSMNETSKPETTIIIESISFVVPKE